MKNPVKLGIPGGKPIKSWKYDLNSSEPGIIGQIQVEVGKPIKLGELGRKTR